ncbi:MAG: MFS transporter [Firmicutes bacterium]|nr:MFS transporter [Bacillota bacterium]
MKKLFHNRNFMLQWFGQSLSGMGNWINFVGLNLYVYQLTGSGKILGLFLVARMLPSLLFGSIGGYFADRYPRRTIMIVCDTIRAILVLGFLFAGDITTIFIIGFIISAIDKIFMAANGSFLPNIVEKEDLLEANSINRMTVSVIMVLGPSLGALLVNAFTYKVVFIVDSATFVVSVICSLLITVPGLSGSKSSKGGIFEGFRTAWVFFMGKSALIFLTFVRLVDALGSGSYNTALPIFSKSFHLAKGAAYGWLVAVWAMGEFTGSLIVNTITKKITVSPKKLFSISVLLMAVGMGLTFRMQNLYLALAFIFLGGVGDGISNVLFNTVLMKESPNEIRGRVYGSTVALVYTVVAIGMAAAGFFIDKFPLHKITDFCTILIVVWVILGFIFIGDKKEQKEIPAEEAKTVTS